MLHKTRLHFQTPDSTAHFQHVLLCQSLPDYCVNPSWLFIIFSQLEIFPLAYNFMVVLHISPFKIRPAVFFS